MNRPHVSMTEGADVEALATSVVDAAFKVHQAFGPGLLEQVYQRCLLYELERKGLSVANEVAIPLTYGDLRFATAYRLDILVGGKLVVEIKTVETFIPVHRSQVLTYLKLLDLKLGLLINFNVPVIKDGIRRVIR